MSWPAINLKGCTVACSEGTHAWLVVMVNCSLAGHYKPFVLLLCSSFDINLCSVVACCVAAAVLRFHPVTMRVHLIVCANIQGELFLWVGLGFLQAQPTSVIAWRLT